MLRQPSDVHQRILSDRLPHALVLEDDPLLTPHLSEIAQAATAAAPQGWDFIHLSSVINRAVYAVAKLPHGHHLVRHMRPPRSVAGYIVSRSGAAKMLKPAPRTRTVDLDLKLAHERALDVLGVHPSPVIWGDHLPSTMAFTGVSGWNAPTSRRAALESFLYSVGKLGIAPYIRCSLANLHFTVERRLTGRPRDAVPVVGSAA